MFPHSMHIVVATILIAMTGACSEISPEKGPTHDPALSHFDVIPIGDVSESSVKEITALLEENRSRIMEDLDVEELPRITVKVWADPGAFKEVFSSEGGSGGVTTGYVNTKLMEIRILKGPDAGSVAVHEFAHIVILAVNPSVPPFWLWEAVALYEDESPPPNTSELTCISPASAPTLDELNTYPGTTKIFRMGYLLADYIVENWNRAALVSLIQNNGDIELSFGISQETFESDWLAYVMATYTFDTGGGLSMTRTELLHSFAGNTRSNETYGQSIFMAKDGHFVYGIDGVVQGVGRWWVSDSDELCSELVGTGETHCSRWYKKDESIYRLASNTDCILQDWERTIGDSQGLEQLRQP